MLLIQFLSGLTTHTAERTSIEGTSSPLQAKKLKQLDDLCGDIEKYFSVRLNDKMKHEGVIKVIED